jgi:hypothetical protein
MCYNNSIMESTPEANTPQINPDDAREIGAKVVGFMDQGVPTQSIAETVTKELPLGLSMVAENVLSPEAQAEADARAIQEAKELAVKALIAERKEAKKELRTDDDYILGHLRRTREQIEYQVAKRQSQDSSKRRITRR